MGLNDAPLLFNFEIESSENLKFIPMVVRFNLDRFGLRISLEQWQMLPHEDRALLARFPVDEDTAIEPNFDHALFEMMRTHANVEPEWFSPEDNPAWRDTAAVPETVLHQANLAHLSPPGVDDWARLDPFKRYVLAKLARKSASNHDFLPAMKEFGLAG
ncbi:NAD-dependent aldehyde dehydrogenase associated with FdhD [Paraburkholderia piptadeniae]|uniref:NAD-dependent aldehyde dehydrogenase associated with FdhD n=1 Tax=Paraburkholderia piptadeniae TaxID=1701573 RepID=A0A1N7RWV3_9BURK|nr:nitrate reductase associated protein [Paraburkholderia piptadeniae]SIT39578.1 NAD-dependent aldehyde dehydrogenase associated with FdhD [Paraburkholderia piptadeniae]